MFLAKKGFSCPFFQLLFLGFLLCFKIISDPVKFAVICKRSLARNLDLVSVFLCFCQKIIFMAIFLTFSIGIFLYFFQKHFSFPWHLPAICQDVGRNDISSSDFSNFFLPSQFLTNFWNFWRDLVYATRGTRKQISQLPLVINLGLSWRGPTWVSWRSELKAITRIRTNKQS